MRLFLSLSSCDLYLCLRCRLVPSCYVIFDLEPLSLSFEFVFTSEISKSLSFSLERLCRLAILCLDQHAHTLHHLKRLLTISLDRLDILKEDLVYQSLRKNPLSYKNSKSYMVSSIAMKRECGSDDDEQRRPQYFSIINSPGLIISWNEASPSLSYMNPEIKLVAIKRVDEYDFVIRPDLVRLTSSSVGSFYSINTIPVISNSNSCHDVAVLSAGGTTFGTSFELDGSLLWS
ncbi:hypothetical protein Tco_0584289 [Tanacetum coccineum]